MVVYNLKSVCEQAAFYYYDYLYGENQQNIPEKIITHITQCQHCLSEIERLKAVLAEDQGSNNQSTRKIDSVLAANLRLHFAYIGLPVTCAAVKQFLPSLANPVLAVGIPTPITVHLAECNQCAKDLETIRQLNLDHKQLCQLSQLFTDHARTCPDCMAEMQKLHETICGIIERKESGIATLFEIDQSAKTEHEISDDSIHNDFSVKVKVLTNSDNAIDSKKASTISFISALKQKVASVNTRPLFKAAIAAAAVILIAFGLFFNTSTVRAVTIEQIYKVVEKIKNVCITSFPAGKTEPAQGIWVSRPLNIYMTKTGKEFVLWDIAAKQRKTINPDTAVIAANPLSADVVNGIERKITGSLGLMPFDFLSEIPRDAQWHQVNDTESAAAGKDVEVYELTWTSKAYNGSLVFKKWRVFVDTKTYFPKKIEWYIKSEVDKEYTLDSVTQVTSLSENEMRDVVKNAFF